MTTVALAALSASVLAFALTGVQEGVGSWYHMLALLLGHAVIGLVFRLAAPHFEVVDLLIVAGMLGVLVRKLYDGIVERWERRRLDEEAELAARLVRAIGERFPEDVS